MLAYGAQDAIGFGEISNRHTVKKKPHPSDHIGPKYRTKFGTGFDDRLDREMLERTKNHETNLSPSA